MDVFGKLQSRAISKNLPFFAKIPGDIVWERARNQGFTSKSIDVFQTQKLTLKFWFLRYLFSYALNNSKRVIVPSDHLGSLCRIWGVQQEKITKISNSVKSPTAPDKLGFKREFDFITVSRLVSWKGIKEVIRAVALLDARLLIVGDGPERQELEELAFQLKADVVFTGESSQREIPILLRQASSFVLNSDFEATSYALLEAQAEGLIVIANAGTGSEEIISHKLNGLLCGEKTGLSLEQAMRLTLETGEEIQFMRDAARINVAKNFNIEINYKQISNLCIHDH
jgi:glycosyltransferase involved in cell wall biosynthesis